MLKNSRHGDQKTTGEKPGTQLRKVKKVVGVQPDPDREADKAFGQYPNHHQMSVYTQKQQECDSLQPSAKDRDAAAVHRVIHNRHGQAHLHRRHLSGHGEDGEQQSYDERKSQPENNLLNSQ